MESATITLSRRQFHRDAHPIDGQAGTVGGATRGVGFLSALGPGENARVSFMEEMVCEFSCYYV